MIIIAIKHKREYKKHPLFLICDIFRTYIQQLTEIRGFEHHNHQH